MSVGPGPLQPVFRGLESALLEHAAHAFAEVVTAMNGPSGGLRTTALFGHGIR